MGKRVHLYVNPRNGEEVCARAIDPDERYRWNAYQRSNRRIVDCIWCRRISGLPVRRQKAQKDKHGRD
jgi:hypothetical protein